LRKLERGQNFKERGFASWEAFAAGDLFVLRLRVELGDNIKVAAAPHGGHSVPSNGGTGITVRGGLGNASAFRPDLLLSLPGHGTAHHVLLPVDAKYKRYDRHGVSAADIHQLLTYSVGYAPADAPRRR
jgi:hypothetical protein